jgi:hypothetical protein
LSRLSLQNKRQVVLQFSIAVGLLWQTGCAKKVEDDAATKPSVSDAESAVKEKAADKTASKSDGDDSEENPFKVDPNEPCDECEQRICTKVNGKNFVEDCYEGNRADLCKAVMQCAEKTKCARKRSLDCYCGSANAAECVSEGGKGPCREDIEKAALTKDPKEISLRYADPQYAVGRAVTLIDCKRAYCPKCNE